MSNVKENKWTIHDQYNFGKCEMRLINSYSAGTVFRR